MAFECGVKANGLIRGVQLERILSLVTFLENITNRREVVRESSNWSKGNQLKDGGNC